MVRFKKETKLSMVCPKNNRTKMDSSRIELSSTVFFYAFQFGLIDQFSVNANKTYLKFLRPHQRQKKYLLKNAEVVTLDVTASPYIPN
jgi:hypothetical protein